MGSDEGMADEAKDRLVAERKEAKAGGKDSR